MPTAKLKSLGFAFEARQCGRGKVLVKCTIPGKATRFVEFLDHRLDNHHGGTPHVCNNWIKGGEEVPVCWETGQKIENTQAENAAKRCAATMCLTQTVGFGICKTEIFK